MGSPVLQPDPAPASQSPAARALPARLLSRLRAPGSGQRCEHRASAVPRRLRWAPGPRAVQGPLPAPCAPAGRAPPCALLQEMLSPRWRWGCSAAAAARLWSRLGRAADAVPGRLSQRVSSKSRGEGSPARLPTRQWESIPSVGALWSPASRRKAEPDHGDWQQREVSLEGSSRSHVGTWLCTPRRYQTSPCPRGEWRQCHRAEPCVFTQMCCTSFRDRLAPHHCPSLTTAPGQGDTSTAVMLVGDTEGPGRQGKSRLEEGTLMQELFQ